MEGDHEWQGVLSNERGQQSSVSQLAEHLVLGASSVGYAGSRSQVLLLLFRERKVITPDPFSTFFPNSNSSLRFYNTRQ
jgi:hypothetical protein